MIKAVLFDADGTLFDSEAIRYKAIAICVRELLGTEFLEWDEYIKEYVNGSKSLKELLKIDYKTLERLRLKRAELIKEFVKTDLKFMEGALELILDLYNHNFKLGIVSSSRKDEIDSYLKALKISNYFQGIVTAEDVSKVKPDPEPFIKALTRFSIRPEESVVIEDTENGLIAAKKAGIKCVIVPNSYTYTSNFKKADLIVSSLRELDSDKIKALF
jgi:HAD superfamily hydrolase (TIGR01509 family)